MPRRDPSDPAALYPYEVALIRLAADHEGDDPPGIYGYEAGIALDLPPSVGTVYRALQRLATHGFLEQQEPTTEARQSGLPRRRYILGAKGAELLLNQELTE